MSFLCAVFFLSAPLNAEETKLEIAKNFTLKNQYNKNIKLSELRGQVIVLSFWANWCGSCVPPLRKLEQLQKKYKDRGLSILTVNIEQSVKKQTGLSQKLSLPVLFDSYGEASRLYDVESIPMNILIDRDGYIRQVMGADQVSNVGNVIEALLNE